MANIIKTCGITGKDFVISAYEQEFLKKMDLPFPTLSPEERLKRRLSHRNERRIYKDKCDLTGKPIISLYSEDKPYKVYSQEAWWSDKWDPKDYGRNFDFNRSFFEQFYELQLAVPRLSLMNTKAENSEYCNITTSNKNCYLVFGGDFNEDCMYSVFSMYSKDCMDFYFTDESELSYDLIDCTKCYNCKYSQYSSNCSDSSFLFECASLKNCFFCIGLVNKQYCMFNKQCSREEYEQKIKEFHLDSWREVLRLKEEFIKFKAQFPHKFAHIFNSENVSGDNIYNAKNCMNCFDITGPAEDLKDIVLGGWKLKDAISSDHVGHSAELFYEMLGSIAGYNCAFSTFSWYSHDIFYSDMIVASSENLFGCCNMKKQSYCILNKQYSKDEYFDLKKRIIEHMRKTGEWGEFFPSKYSPWAYNETVANDFFPLSKEQALKEGLKWVDEEMAENTTNFEIPDSIFDVKDDILEKTLVCEKTKSPYKINEKELKFYRKLRIPIPHFAPETRNRLRISLRSSRVLWDKKCDKCGNAIKTPYSPDCPEPVYCEKCYLETVY